MQLYDSARDLYDELVSKNRRLLFKLRKEDRIPFAVFSFTFRPLQKSDYEFFLEYSGRENTLYIVGQIGTFPNTWVATEKRLNPYVSFGRDILNTKEDKLITGIEACIRPHEIILNPLDGFMRLKEHPYYNNIKVVDSGENGRYGIIRIQSPESELSTKDLFGSPRITRESTLEISVLNHHIRLENEKQNTPGQK